MVCSALLKPSARRTCDWRSPSARRMLDCLSPSATLIVAWRVPSDSVITARRLRSALICRFMASWMSRGGTISRISTLVIFTPQRSVTSSSLARRMWLISSRLASTSSSGMSPMTARSVVAASACEAPDEVRDRRHRLLGVEDLRVDQEVDADGRVVLGDAGLLRHLEVELAQVDLHRLLNDRHQQHQARARRHRSRRGRG